MNKTEIKNLPESLRQKLLNRAHKTGHPFNELLQYYAIERFLYRLSRSSFSEQFVLKGALMFPVWGVENFRATRDIDLLGHTTNTLENIATIFGQICALEIGEDGLKFNSETIRAERIKEDADYEGVRVTFLAFLGKARINMQVDIGFGDIIASGPAHVSYPVLLDFSPPELLGYPQETLIAEKFQAMLALGAANSRLKDYYDLWILANHFEFDGMLLQNAIEQTFRQRRTPLPAGIPTALTDDFVEHRKLFWQAFMERIGPVQNCDDFGNVILLLQKFLLPSVHASVSGHVFRAKWDRKLEWRNESKNQHQVIPEGRI